MWSGSVWLVAARSGSVLTQRGLNRAVLARQLLLDRADLTLPRAAEQVAGIQAQYAPAIYVGLWSRLHGLTRDALTKALEERTVVQGTLLRSTIHLVSARDYWPFAAAIRSARREWWLRAHSPRVDEGAVVAAADRLRDRLADGPVRRKELAAIVGDDLVGGINLWIDLVRAPPSGTWSRRRADLFAAAESWLGRPDPALTTEDALAHLVRRYLGGFGPAARRDIASWAGLPIGAIADALDRMDLRRFRDEDGAELLDLPGAPLPDPGTRAPVRFIPWWDAILLAHARRSGILPERHRARVFNTKTPQSVPTFLVDGAVAGAWRFDEGTVRLDPFEPLDRPVLRQLQEEAEALAAFCG